MKEILLINDISQKFGSLMNARGLAVLDSDEIFDFLFFSSQYKDEYKKRFFKKQGDALIFLKDALLDFLDLRLLSDSYTKFSNKIGLGTNEKNFLKSSDNVVLNFPFKDCVLKGAQKKDDDKSTELFFNNILAKSQIDMLFRPKVLKNFEIFGEKSLENELQNKPNLLIKGNNLIALHTLKRRKDIYGQVKLIYIDPPYNTGNDSFNYNDRFNHSAWLCFMKNRLEIAREFLRDDGVIFIQCDDNEQAYLKVLCDEIFGRENFVSCLVWANKEGGGKSDSKHFRNKHEFILCFAKKKEMLTIYPQDVEDIDRYTLSDEYIKERGKYQLIKLDSGSLGWVKSLDYPIELNGIIFYAGGSKEKWLDRQQGGASIKDWGWRWSKDKLEWGLKNGFVVTKQNNKGEWNIYTKQYLNCDKDGNLKPRTIQPMALLEKHSNTQSNRHMKELFDKAIFSYSKPEGLIMDILKFATQENDLVMDFFAGSGTTLAVALKMKRRFIGIEQMDYIENITKERLKKVIEGEQGGISKAVNFNGGGNFIYCELAELNNYFRKLILNASNENDLNKIYKILAKQAFIDYRVDILKDLNNVEFLNILNFDEKKKILLKCLDRNMDYMPYADINDSDYNIDEKIKKLNKIFYEIK